VPANGSLSKNPSKINKHSDNFLAQSLHFNTTKAGTCVVKSLFLAQFKNRHFIYCSFVVVLLECNQHWRLYAIGETFPKAHVSIMRQSKI